MARYFEGLHAAAGSINVYLGNSAVGGCPSFLPMVSARIKDLYIGGPLNQLPTKAATIAGKGEVIMSIGQGFTFGEAPPSDIFALSIQSLPTATVTSTSTTTSVSSVAGPATTITTTVSGVVSTMTIPGSTTTVTSAAATVTSVSTSRTGVSSTALYGVALVALIFIMATGYLAMRGRKHASQFFMTLQ